jgi:hypothetical protein
MCSRLYCLAPAVSPALKPLHTWQP